MKESVWMPEEDERLIALRATGLKWHVVAKKLGRTEAATVSPAGTLQLKRLTPEKKAADAKTAEGSRSPGPFGLG